MTDTLVWPARRAESVCHRLASRAAHATTSLSGRTISLPAGHRRGRPQRHSHRRAAFMSARTALSDDQPLAPDRAGLCYLDRRHFLRVMDSVARRHLSPKWIFRQDTLPGMLALLVAYLLYVVAVGAWIPSGPVPLLVAGAVVGLVWYRRRGRLIRRALLRRMCLECGYSLRRLPTDATGRGTCPECGRRYSMAEYKCPPRGYRRFPN